MSGGGLTGTNGLLSKLDPLGKAITNNSVIGDPLGLYHNSNSNINAQNAANSGGPSYLNTLAGGYTGGTGPTPWAGQNPQLSSGPFNMMAQAGAAPYFGAKGGSPSGQQNAPPAGAHQFLGSQGQSQPYGMQMSQILPLLAMFL